MGCVLSTIDEDGRVGICKERKKVIKQLVYNREQFSDSLLAYLKSLRNTGATLRQFTESDTLELDFASTGLPEPPSPPPNLLPPPPPPFLAAKRRLQVGQDEIVGSDVDMLQIDPSLSSPLRVGEVLEEENWEETKTEFEFEDEVLELEDGDVSVGKSRSGKQRVEEELVDDNSLAISLFRKENCVTKAMPMVVGRNGKTLEGIVKELDDHFLKASACIKEIAVLIDISSGDTLLRQNSGRQDSKRSNSARVFSVLSWSRSKSPQFNKDDAEFSSPSEPCRPGAHCATLKKLYAAEKKLYKAVKEEGIAKLEFERKSSLLQKQEDEHLDLVKIDKTRSNAEKLESELISLRQCISETTSSILELIDEELLPQLVGLTAGLAQMWRVMHECHQSQTLISQQLSNLCDNHNTILNSEYHHQATIQFEGEASYWYNSFCKLIKSQREYVRSLSKWIQLTSCLREGHKSGDHSSIHTICEQWEIGLDGLPDKEVADSIKNLLLSIRSIIAQQAEEDNILKKLEKLERKLQRSSTTLAEIQKKVECNLKDGDDEANISPKHPLYHKKAETDVLNKQVESVKADYLDSVQYSRTMTLDNLRTRLPHLFLSLMEFSSASFQAIESINSESSQ